MVGHIFESMRGQNRFWIVEAFVNDDYNGYFKMSLITNTQYCILRTAQEINEYFQLVS